MTRIVLVRHGQTAWNREARFRGQSDPELDPFGLEQAEATGRYVAARWPVVAVYTSPLQRALRTAEAIARAQGLDAQPLAGLLDIHFGECQGLRFEEVRQRNPDLVRAWEEAPHTVHFPGGESLDDVRERILAGLTDVVGRFPAQSVALVSHTVANRVLLCGALGLGNEYFWRFQQDTCGVSVFDVAGDDAVLQNDAAVQQSGAVATIVQLNDTSHLQALAGLR